MKNNFVAILDFGSSKVTCMAATKVAGRSDFVIRAVGQSAYNGFDDNSWYEPETISFAVTDAISQVEKKMDSPIKEIFVGVPGVFCATVTSEASVTFHSKKKIDGDDIQELIKKADIFDVGSDNIPMGGKPVYFILDGALKTFDPVGSVASKLTALVSFSFMKNYFRNSVSPVLLQKGIKKVTYMNTCDAETQFIAQTMGLTDYCIVVDVGHITTNVMLSGGKSLLFSRTFSLGSGYLASDLCQVEGCEYKVAMATLEKINFSLEFREGDTYNVNGVALDAKRTNEILKARIGQIADYIIKSFQYCDKEIPYNTPVILTGGGLTYLRGGAYVLSTFLGKNVKVYESANPQTNRNEYTSCYGLLAEAIKNNGARSSIFAFLRR
ncbi:cell division protein ftsA [Corallococcus sp. CAG:1435]|uniref:SHS2 domain-containing protein n=1 Tax=Candidatus Fimimonas gallinarum TaxID=2840821 RepID=A0A9D1E367_9BACT|nr:cell division protein ftsA [Corallococcus sp. CAG:1435]HIR65400.1 hypothetical protein [Candidatus Fimimonas gallinarum]